MNLNKKWNCYIKQVFTLPKATISKPYAKEKLPRKQPNKEIQNWKISCDKNVVMSCDYCELGMQKIEIFRDNAIT